MQQLIQVAKEGLQFQRLLMCGKGDIKLDTWNAMAKKIITSYDTVGTGEYNFQFDEAFCADEL